MKETVTISKEEYESLLALKNTKETVTISKEEYESLLEDSNKLLALEGAGVDNWEGYGYAIELLEEMNEEGEKID
jgi:PHD/YefM family antitoxin component YafN of YafNO toxin-antitoxin module